MKRRGRRALADEDGQSATEYIVLTSLAAVLALAAVNILFGPIRAQLQQIARAILGTVTG